MKWFSRKLFVFLLATMGLGFGLLSENGWLIIAGTYIGAQLFVDLLKTIKNDRQ